MYFGVLEISLDKIVKIRKASKFSTSFLSSNLKNELHQDFPGDPVVKNSPSKAGDMGSIQVMELASQHAAGQLSQWAGTRNPWVTRRENPCPTMKTQCGQKKKKATLLTSLTLHPAREFVNSSLATTDAPNDLDALLILAEFGFSVWD